jgi:hypothetical protein
LLYFVSLIYGMRLPTRDKESCGYALYRAFSCAAISRSISKNESKGEMPIIQNGLRQRKVGIGTGYNSGNCGSE